MASVNKVILVGNLGRDPEVRYMPSGDAVANIALATSSKYKNKAGEMVEETEWHRISFFGRQAEIVGEYLKKGRSVYVEGRLKTRKWQDKDTGADRFSTDIVADQMQMLGGREGGGMGGGGDGGYDEMSQAAPQQRSAPRPSAPRQAPQGGGRAAPAPSAAPNFADMDDDIPF